MSNHLAIVNSLSLLQHFKDTNIPKSKMADSTQLIQSIQKRLQILEDKEALAVLLNRYCSIADAKDWQGYASTFAEDGHMTFEDWGTIHGREAIAKAAGAEQIFDGLQHSMTNVNFEVNGSDTAKGSAYLLMFATPDTKVPDTNYMFGGPYKFEFRRGNSGWEITSMRLKKIWAVGQDTEGVFTGA